MLREGVCKRCHKLAKLNRKGYCMQCAFQRAVMNLRQLKSKRGPFYKKWRKAYESWRAKRGEAQKCRGE